MGRGQPASPHASLRGANQSQRSERRRQAAWPAAVMCSITARRLFACMLMIFDCCKVEVKHTFLLVERHAGTEVAPECWAAPTPHVFMR